MAALGPFETELSMDFSPGEGRRLRVEAYRLGNTDWQAEPFDYFSLWAYALLPADRNAEAAEEGAAAGANIASYGLSERYVDLVVPEQVAARYGLDVPEDINPGYLAGGFGRDCTYHPLFDESTPNTAGESYPTAPPPEVLKYAADRKIMRTFGSTGLFAAHFLDAVGAIERAAW